MPTHLRSFRVNRRTDGPHRNDENKMVRTADPTELLEQQWSFLRDKPTAQEQWHTSSVAPRRFMSKISPGISQAVNTTTLIRIRYGSAENRIFRLATAISAFSSPRVITRQPKRCEDKQQAAGARIRSRTHSCGSAFGGFPRPARIGILRRYVRDSPPAADRTSVSASRGLQERSCPLPPHADARDQTTLQFTTTGVALTACPLALRFCPVTKRGFWRSTCLLTPTPQLHSLTAPPSSS